MIWVHRIVGGGFLGFMYCNIYGRTRFQMVSTPSELGSFEIVKYMIDAVTEIELLAGIDG